MKLNSSWRAFFAVALIPACLAFGQEPPKPVAANFELEVLADSSDHEVLLAAPNVCKSGTCDKADTAKKPGSSFQFSLTLDGLKNPASALVDQVTTLIKSDCAATENCGPECATECLSGCSATAQACGTCQSDKGLVGFVTVTGDGKCDAKCDTKCEAACNGTCGTACDKTAAGEKAVCPAIVCEVTKCDGAKCDSVACDSPECQVVAKLASVKSECPACQTAPCATATCDIAKKTDSTSVSRPQLIVAPAITHGVAATVCPGFPEAVSVQHFSTGGPAGQTPVAVNVARAHLGNDSPIQVRVYREGSGPATNRTFKFTDAMPASPANATPNAEPNVDMNRWTAMVETNARLEAYLEMMEQRMEEREEMFEQFVEMATANARLEATIESMESKIAMVEEIADAKTSMLEAYVEVEKKLAKAEATAELSEQMLAMYAEMKELATKVETARAKPQPNTLAPAPALR